MSSMDLRYLDDLRSGSPASQSPPDEEGHANRLSNDEKPSLQIQIAEKSVEIQEKGREGEGKADVAARLPARIRKTVEDTSQ